jgi:tyrosyl-tRNA synthetase
MSSGKDIFRYLTDKECVHQCSNETELRKKLAAGPVTFYCGFDPTADSLHVGSLVPLLLMRRLQAAGHKAIGLIGTSTGMIGDPSFKSEERVLLSEDTVQQNAGCIEQQIKKIVGGDSLVTVRNGDWLSKLSMIEFLRDTGKHFSVNSMIAKESVKTRLTERNQGISYTEFSYILLQSYDFLHLFKQHNCTLQIGGSDQWGNITEGIDLIRRVAGGHAFGLTNPLLLTSAGKKFGKTEDGNVWLDAKRTSPYKFYQYWLNTADEDVVRFIKIFTEADDAAIVELESEVKANPAERSAQKFLASEVTTLVHGKLEAEKAAKSASILFGGDLLSVDAGTLQEIFSDVPSFELSRSTLASGIAVVDLVVTSGLFDSKGAAKRAIEGGGLSLNQKKVTNLGMKIEESMAIDGQLLIFKSGKKNYQLIRLS